MQHNFLTEATNNYLNATVKAKSKTDKFYTDREFFKITQEQKLREANVIYFNFEQGLVGKKLAQQFADIYDYDEYVNSKLKDKDFLEERGLNIEEASSLKWVHLIYPETVNIDYSEYSDEKFYKGDLFIKEYKDGLLAVTQNTKGMGNVSLSLGPAREGLIYTNLMFSIGEEHFYNFANIDWANKKFENLVLYVVAPKINKTKAIKIILKNNKRWNKIINVYKNNPDWKVNKVNDLELSFLRKRSGNLRNLNYLRDERLAQRIFSEHKGDGLKNTLLKIGFDKVLLSNYMSFLNDSDAFLEEKEEIKNYNNIIIDNKFSFDDLKQMYLKEIFPHEQKLSSNFIPQEKNREFWKVYYKKRMIKSIVLNKFCSFDTLPNGSKINLENKSDSDCFFFWINIDLFEIFFNLFNEYNTKLSFDISGLSNDQIVGGGKKFSLHTRLSPYWSVIAKDENEDLYSKIRDISNQEFDFKHKHILQEAIESETGYLMPYDGAFELLDDPVYKFIRFREYEDLISIVISDKNERCLVEVFDKKKIDFKYMIFNDMKVHIDASDQCIADIYLKLATCIRDAKVLIERDSTMKFRGRRTPHGCNTKSTYEIYFPRVRYRRNPNKEQLRKEKDFFAESRKFSGTRRQHARKLVAGYKADKKQLLLAKQMDFYVPEGHTYVKASTWGDNMTKREVRYRHTDLNGIFYYDTKEMSEAQKIDRMSSAGFEEYCERYIQKLGYEVKHRSNYDGGIDIRAVKILDNMEAEDLLVQCKHWNSPVPPGAMRDFKTACDMEESKNSKKFMFITSSRFSPGAVELADKFDIEIVDGDRLVNEME